MGRRTCVEGRDGPRRNRPGAEQVVRENSQPRVVDRGGSGATSAGPTPKSLPGQRSAATMRSAAGRSNRRPSAPKGRASRDEVEVAAALWLAHPEGWTARAAEASSPFAPHLRPENQLPKEPIRQAQENRERRAGRRHTRRCTPKGAPRGARSLSEWPARSWPVPVVRPVALRLVRAEPRRTRLPRSARRMLDCAASCGPERSRPGASTIRRSSRPPPKEQAALPKERRASGERPARRELEATP